LLLAGARGVTPRHPPVLVLHVFLSLITAAERCRQREVATTGIVTGHRHGANGRKSAEGGGWKKGVGKKSDAPPRR
jgi:hypothetical protein